MGATVRPARRSPHRAGRITPDNVLDADPRRRTSDHPIRR